MTEVTVFQGEIALQSTDLIVNPVRRSLAAAAGVDGAIRSAAGPRMTAALASPGALAEGATLITPGFNLPARWVVHAVPPLWNGGVDRSQRISQFRDTHRACLRAAAHLDGRSIAFPAIGVGIHGWPLDVAADAAMESVCDWIDAGFSTPALISFVCASPSMAEIFRRAAEDWELPLRRQEQMAGAGL